MRPRIDEACRALGLAEPRRVGGQLPPAALTALLRDNPGGLHFWVTDVFHRVAERIPPERCFRFWKAEVRSRLLEDGIFSRDLWLDGYAYLAQQWCSPFPEPLVELLRCE